MAAAIDFLSNEYRTDPYPILARLRREEPVHQDEYGVWILTRHADIVAIDHDSRMGRDYRHWHTYPVLRPFLAGSALEQLFESWLLSRDPPDHTRLRKLAAHAFTPSAVGAMRDIAESTADALLTSLRDTECVEFISAFAGPYPVHMITRIMGLPDGDYALLRRWSEGLVPVLEPRRSTGEMRSANAIVEEMQQYLREHIAARHRQPTADLIGHLVAAHDEGERLNEQELIAMLVLLVFAGQVTTANLIGNAMLTMLRHPDEMARVRSEPALMRTAIEEFLRFESPTAMSARVAVEDIDVDGRCIRRGDLVLSLLGAANRDPAVFTEPDRLDVGRYPNPHVAFGGGVHYCLGAPLARLEAKVVFERLLARWDRMELDESGVEWLDSVSLRGLRSLPLRIRAAD